ncbi:MAG: SusC/RagA family TonB-linked outer membrane protein [Gemmatimonadaceae bacterium]
MRRTGLTPRLRSALVAFAMLAVSGFARAQAQVVISGTVTSEQGDKLQNANVFINEFNISVATNEAGFYTVTLTAARLRGAASLTVRARAIGFSPVSKTTTATTQTIDFKLKRDINRLNEVIVAGVTAGTQQKMLPFSIARVDAADLTKSAATDPLAALEGKVPGANITSASGRPGAPPAILLGAPTSIATQGRGTAPLYVVDGIILGDQLSATGGGGLSGINPNDIDNIEILKGAAAASLYGARGGNGVIAITTKTARAGADGFHTSIRADYGISDIERQLPIAQTTGMRMDPTMTRFCINVSGAYAAPATGTFASNSCARSIDYPSVANFINSYPDVFAQTPPTFPVDPGSTVTGSALKNVFQIDNWPGVNYNAVAQFVDPKPYTQQNIAISGKSGPNTMFASGNYTRQQGAIKYLNGFQRATARLNAGRSTEDWNFALTSSFAHDTKDGYQEEDGGAAFFRLTRTPPIVNLDAVDGLGRLYIRPNLQGGGSQNFNPLYELQNYAQTTATNRFTGGAAAQWRPMTWFTMNFNFSYDGTAATAISFQDKGYRTTTGPAGTANSGLLQRRAEAQQQYNAGVDAAVTHTFFTDLNSRTSLRYLFDRTDYNYQVLAGNWLGVVGLPNAANIGSTPSGTPSQTVGSSLTTVRGLGYFLSEDIDWKDRYIVSALVRRDASSLFGSGHRWSTFGRGSVAWRVAQESWWFIPALDEFKLHASVGAAGNRPAFVSQYETFSLSSGNVGNPVTLGNRNLRPEKVFETELGIDGELFHRIGFSLTSSRTDSRDQILVVPVASYYGYSQQYQNAGTLAGRAFEASLNIPWVNTENFSTSTRLTYDRAKSKITKLNVPAFTAGAAAQGTGALFFVRQGEEYGTFYGRKFITSCGQLPTAAQSSCGAGKDFQANSNGYVVWTGSGNTPADGITNNLWQARLPLKSPFFSPAAGGDASHFNTGQVINWGMPMVERDSTGAAKILALGHALPTYRWSLAQTANYKRLSASFLLDASKGRSVYNQGRGWGYLDFLSADDQQTGKDVSTVRPLGYYYRAALPDNGSGTGGLYDILGPNSAVTEDASFVKLREATVSFHVGSLGRLGGDWSVTGTGRNLKTWTKYTGFDPEVGYGAVSGTGGASANSPGSAVLNAVDAYQFPNLRTFTISLSTNF